MWFFCRLFPNSRFCQPPDPPPPLPPSTGPPPPQGQQAVNCMLATNRARLDVDKPALTLDNCLASQAQEWAEEMQRRHIPGQPLRQALSHEGFYGRMRACEKGTGAENVAAGHPTGKEVVNGWLNSVGHRENMLKRSYRKGGVGYANDDGNHWWCMLYATSD